MGDIDKLLASSPIDRTAARVVQGGIHWEPNSAGNPSARRWDAPPMHLLQPHPKVPTFIDHTGAKLGRFTVIGFLGKLNPKKKSVWLVRCACGSFETRGSAAIQNRANQNDRCEGCRYLDRVKEGRGNPMKNQEPRP